MRGIDGLCRSALRFLQPILGAPYDRIVFPARFQQYRHSRFEFLTRFNRVMQMFERVSVNGMGFRGPGPGGR